MDPNTFIILEVILSIVGWLIGALMIRAVVGLADEKPVPGSPACSCSTVWPYSALLGIRRNCSSCGAARPGWFILLPIATALLFAIYAYALLIAESQFLAWSGAAHPIIEVRPDEIWMWGRLPYHLILITLLIAATATDLRDYVIPDQIVIPGAILGVLLATISGDLQIMHLWVDWAHEQPGLSGPYIPQWIKDYHHLHGLAWSLAGLVTGAGITWVLRFLSGLLLGQPAMGFGDVTLMAMIGSFLGWQPVIFVILFAPACAIVFGLIIRIFSGRNYFAFGPYLAMGTLVVLLTWRWVWPNTHDIFGHWQSLALLFGISTGTLVLLLGGLRVFRAIPVSRTK